MYLWGRNSMKLIFCVKWGDSMINYLYGRTLKVGDTIMIESDFCIIKEDDNGKLYTIDSYGNKYDEQEIVGILNNRIES